MQNFVCISAIMQNCISHAQILMLTEKKHFHLKLLSQLEHRRYPIAYFQVRNFRGNNYALLLEQCLDISEVASTELQIVFQYYNSLPSFKITYQISGNISAQNKGNRKQEYKSPRKAGKDRCSLQHLGPFQQPNWGRRYCYMEDR